MSYNNIGLSTARGSGTSGYIVKNNSALRPGFGQPGGAFAGHQRYEDYLNEIAKPPVHREPDAGILEHERKRQIEIKCLELRDQMEDQGADDDEIEDAVTALRTKLQSANVVIPGKRATDSHSVAVAKQAEMTRMGRALHISADHVEGRAFQRETDEERAARLAEKEAREQERIDAAVKREKEEALRQKEWEHKERLRRREEYRRKRDEERRARKERRREEEGRGRSRSRSRSPVKRSRDDDSGSRSPVKRSRDDSPRRGRDDSRSRSPVKRRDRDESPRRGREDSRSVSPARRPATPSPSRGCLADRDRSPSPRRDASRSPSRSRSRSPSHSRSPAPRRRSPTDSRSPPPRRRDDSRSPPRRRRRRHSDSESD